LTPSPGPSRIVAGVPAAHIVTTRRLPKAYATLRTRHAILRFYHGDALDVFERLGRSRVDVIVTSPPYNLGVQYRTYNDSLSADTYQEWSDRWLRAAAGALTPAGSLFLNVGTTPTKPWTAFDIANTARGHLMLQNTIHWIKSIAIARGDAGSKAGLERDLAVGHYKPINSARFVNECQEFIFHFSPGGHTPLDRLAIGVPYQDKSNVGRWQGAGADLRCRGNTWFIPYSTIQNRKRDRPHPATFPPALPRQCLRLHGLSRAGLAMDPFLGLGSSAVACAELGVNFVGVEIDQTYLDEAIERVRALDGVTQVR
jgi:site-specific DNA-methyltransferase (adenine-specific)